MRICLITAYDLSRDGGVNRQVLGLAATLRRAGDEVAVLGPASGTLPYGCHGLPGVIGIPGNGSMAHIGLATRPAATLRFLRAHRFDLLHLHAPLIPGPARQAAAGAQTPMVATFHASAEHETALSRGMRSIACRPLKRLRAAMAVSKVARAFSRRIYPGPIEVIPCGIDVAAFERTSPSPHPGLKAPGPPHILFVGRFCEPRKGLRYLLQAVALLRARGRPMRLTIAGPGQPHKFADASHPDTTFSGRVDDATLAHLYHRADIFCAPSIGSESFGLVLIEAMAAGCPVIATGIPGYAEAADNCASLVAPKDASALAQALGWLATDEAQRATLRRLGAARAGALAWGHIAPRVRRIYAAALATG